MSKVFVKRRTFCRSLGALPLAWTSSTTFAVADRPAQATPDTLTDLIRGAAPGKVISLAPGDYKIILDQVRFEPNALTLRPSDPSRPPRVLKLELRGVAGLHMDGLLFRPDNITNKEAVIDCIGARDIILSHCTIEGVATSTGFGSGIGLRAKAATICRIEGSVFQELYRGAVFSQSQDLEIRNCILRGMASDGLDFAQVRDVRVIRNTFHGFRRPADSKAHPDMIQFWTRSTHSPSKNILIQGNLMMVGQGMWTQSIFMRNEVVDSLGAGLEMFYRNILIEGNLILNAHLHGITVGETQGLGIQNNTLVRDARAAGKSHSHGLWTPRINVSARARNVALSSNITASIEGHADQPDWTVANNLLVQDRARMKPGFYGAVFGVQALADPSTPTSFIIKPGTDLARRGIGAGPKIGAIDLR